MAIIKEERIIICQHFLNRLKAANEKVRTLKEDKVYLAHIQKIKDAEHEANIAMNELDQVMWSI